MRLEAVREQLEQWGEVIVSTNAGQSFELHTGDTRFDTEKRLIVFKSGEAEYVLDGDAVEVVKKHYSHPMGP